MLINKRTIRHALLASTAAFIGASPALAQTAPAETGAAADQVSGDIVVTANRRSESIQKAAIAIAAISADELTKAGVASTAELSRLVPSVQITTGTAATPFYFVRGVGSVTGNSLTDPAVTVSLDGVPMARPYNGGGQFFDLERVEVLKGPQGTLYGRNATGGVVNILFAKPKLGETSADIAAEIGNYDSRKANGNVNLPLGEIAAVRGSFSIAKRDGYMSDGSDDEDSKSGRLQVLVEPTDALSVRLAGDYYKADGRGTGSTPLASSTVVLGATVPTAGFPIDQRVGFDDPRAAPLLLANLEAFSPTLQHIDNTYYGVSATVDWTTDLGTLTLIPSYRKTEIDSFSQYGFGFSQAETDKQTSLEARFASKEDQRLRWILGGFYQKDEVDTSYLISAGTVGFPLFGTNFDNVTNGTFETESFAGFLDGTFDITDTLRLIGGVRYTHEEKTVAGTRQTGPFNLNTFTFDGGATIALNDSLTFNQTTWRGGVQWDVAPQSMLYATVSRGFHSGGFFFSSDEATYAPEFLTAYTIGSKNRFFDNKTLLNIEVFKWEYEDQQVSHISFDSAFNLIFKTENAGASTIQGVEVELQQQIASGTKVGAQVQYLDATYDTFTYTQPAFPPLTSCQTTPGAGPVFTVNCAGATLPQSPEWTLNLAAQQVFPLANGAEITFDYRGHYQTDSDGGTGGTLVERQEAYWLHDASVAYNAPEGRWSVTGFVNNIADETVQAGNIAAPFTGIFGPQLYAAQLRPPRTYGVRVAARF